jgi:chitinase
MVAAIDFGTTYSGFAYSYKGEYDKNKLDIYANQIWNSGGKQFLSQKTPTCILLNKDKEFESFVCAVCRHLFICFQGFKILEETN